MSSKSKIVAISGKSGCGNTTVTGLVSKALGFEMINYTFHSMADEEGIPFEEFCKMAEKDPSWDYKLDETQVKLATEQNSVLGSRLAIWMLKEADVKIFLTASPEVRASRILNREGGDLIEHQNKTAARDARDHQRYLNLYKIDNDDYSFADLIINTDRLSAKDVAEIILKAAEQVFS